MKKILIILFFIWSNDFSQLREYFPEEKFIFVDNSLESNDVYDLYLMTLCKNFILSPSTFHYWGAYLSKHKNKICLGPPKIKIKVVIMVLVITKILNLIGGFSYFLFIKFLIYVVMLFVDL